MTDEKTEFDVALAHRHFAASCFNRAWDFIDKPERTEQDDLDMLAASFASLFHWTEREDRSATKLSVAYWQLSRVYVLLGQAAPAAHFGRLALDRASDPGTPPFYRGYAHEALARSAALAQNWSEASAELEAGRREAAQVEPEEEQRGLLADLENVSRSLRPNVTR